MSDHAPSKFAYMDAITTDRAIEQYADDPEGQLHGAQLISAEAACADEQGIVVFFHNYFEKALVYMQQVDSTMRFMMLAYFLVMKTQGQIAPIMMTTQTITSFNIRAAVRVMSSIIMFGGQRPDLMTIKRILLSAKKDVWPLNVRWTTSELLEEYIKSRDFEAVAEKFYLHRPDLSRTLSRFSHELRESKDREQSALGWYMYSILEKASRTGVGIGRRHARKFGDLEFSDPDVLGQYRIKNPTKQEIEQLFAPHANLLRAVATC